MTKSLFLSLTALLTAGCVDKQTIDTDGVELTSIDQDGDGFSTEDGDCDDLDNSIGPAADELCDGIDNDCDGTIDEGVQDDFYVDADGDGFGSEERVEACEVPDGYSVVTGDCDDAEAESFPGNVEYCDGLDNNCDGVIDEGITSTWYADLDGDGYGDDATAMDACEAPEGYIAEPGDCNDADATFNPDAEEVCSDPTDYNCDGMTEYADVDGDGYAACEECDDTNSSIHPDAVEICDELDNDCDGTIDEDTSDGANVWYEDFDGDGFGEASRSTIGCERPSGYVADATDCDDTDAAVNPAATEVCDDIDNDCDTTIDESDAADAATWYADSDSDTYGDSSAVIVSCDQPSGYVSDDADCDDGDSAQYPGADEYCNGEDDDCDGTVDEDAALDASTWYADDDGDTYGDAADTTQACNQPSGYVSDDTDCDDGNNTQYPGADEYCNGEDDDCDGDTDESGALDELTWYADADADTYGDVATTLDACDQPSGYVTDTTDCDDGDSAQYPGADEYCNGEDDNCDGTVDEDAALDATTWYGDSDGDTYGSAGFSLTQCSQPSGYVVSDADCDDTDAAVNPSAAEVCDGIDNDCDSDIDDDDSSLDASTATWWYTDDDGDGYGDIDATLLCDQPSSTVTNSDDCDDSDAAVNPSATEVCDGIDNDCDSDIDDADSSVDLSTGATWYADTDSDTYGDLSSTLDACDRPSGYVPDDTDCDDGDAAQYPGADEYCNGEDDDCDGATDEDGAVDVLTWYADSDGDAYGDAASSDIDCSQPSGYVSDDTDCDDSAAAVNPAATEVCDSIDNDCDTLIDDADSSLDASTGTVFYTDSDGDTYGDSGAATQTCIQPSGTVTDDTDCDDGDAAQYPGADEYCNGEDDDCDGDTDEDALDGADFYVDDDGDGFGDPSATEWACDGVTNDDDCNDSDSNEPAYVDAASGSASGDGSIDSPYDTIQAGIDAAGECVVVEGGTYTEAIDFGGSDITVTGVDGAASTTIDASGLGAPAVTFASGEQATLQGFTVTGGDGYIESSSSSYACTSITTCTDYYDTYAGGGVYIDGADPFLIDLIIEANSLPVASTTVTGNDTYYVNSYGGGIYVANGTASISGSEISMNDADQGGGVYVDPFSVVSVESSWLVENVGTDGGGFEVDGGELMLLNVAMMWNMATSDGGGTLLIDGVLDATNITQAGDDAPTGGGIYASGTSTVDLINAIIAEAGTGVGVLIGGSASFTGTYNDVYGNVGGNYSGITDPTGSSGNISSDPLFSAWTDDGNSANDDITLSSSSPALDGGDPASAYNDSDGTTNDMGAWGGPGSNW
ncbi:MAG: putative metal-binding motif-containing protein [Myxococcota bacterium]|nr:putative metal-binding motif-containing protein [Myxococcota bacterium]